jgi:hypothetical protein
MFAMTETVGFLLMGLGGLALVVIVIVFAIAQIAEEHEVNIDDERARRA